MNDNVFAIDDTKKANIISTSISLTGETTLLLSGDVAASAQVGSILYILPGSDRRFPFGVAGKVISSSSNTDGTKNVTLGEASSADIVKESSLNLKDIRLDSSNLVGVIVPAAIESASPAEMTKMNLSNSDFYSFRDGAVTHQGFELKVFLFVLAYGIEKAIC